jgi:multiple sugar transport system substrate-binding protein
MGKVALPGIPIDLLMNFYSFCIAHGNCPFQSGDEVIDRETGMLAIAAMKELYSLVDKKMYHNNPIAVAELMTTTDDYWYCPFAYGYSNYSRAGYCMNLLTYGDVVEFNGTKIRTTIGGTGLAVSASSRQKKISLEFAEMIVSPQCQQTMYVQHGGQPGHRQAWLNEDANKMTNQFFKNILPVMDNGYVRPRYNGYLLFQDHAGKFLQECIFNDSDALQALKEMNALYVKSLFVNKSIMSIC